MPTVKVRDVADPETATGPVQGYTAKRSASGTKSDVPLIETAQTINVVTQQDCAASATLWDARMSYELDAISAALSSASLALSVDNVLDKRYVGSCGTETACYWGGGRMAYASVNYLWEVRPIRGAICRRSLAQLGRIFIGLLKKMIAHPAR